MEASTPLPSAARISRSLALRERPSSRISIGVRADQSDGNVVWTSGRAVASTKSGRSRSTRNAESMNFTDGRSPQCRSSRTIDAVEPLCHQVRRTVAHRAVGHMPHDRRVHDLRERDAFTFESSVGIVAAREHHLERDLGAIVSIARQKHAPHSPGRDLAVDLETARDESARCQRSLYRSR